MKRTRKSEAAEAKVRVPSPKGSVGVGVRCGGALGNNIQGGGRRLRQAAQGLG